MSKEIKYLQITVQKEEIYPNTIKLRTKVAMLGQPDAFYEKMLDKDEFTALFDIIFDEAKERIRQFVLKTKETENDRQRKD